MQVSIRLKASFSWVEHKSKMCVELNEMKHAFTQGE
jgi:hypothetical protein